jgi:hypothetical protein
MDYPYYCPGKQIYYIKGPAKITRPEAPGKEDESNVVFRGKESPGHISWLNR